MKGLYETKDLQAWRYCIGACHIIIGGSVKTLEPMCITGIEILNNYYENLFPIFKVNFLLDSDTYYSVLNKKTEVKIKLRIQKYYKKYDNKDIKSAKQDYLNDTFIIIDDNDDANREADLDLIKKNQKVSSDAEMDRYDKPLELYLYREETATGVKTQMNKIFKEANMSSIIGYLLGESKIKNALVSPLENNNTYSTILLPPMTINKALLHLDAAYGFYKQGSVIYFGIDRTYILNFKGGCTAYESGELQETVIFIPKTLSVANAAGGTLQHDHSKHYINWKYDDVNFKNSSVSKNVLSGSDVAVVKPVKKSVIRKTSKTKVIKKANTAVIVDEANNPWLDSTFTAQTSSNSLIIYGAMVDIDCTALTPNKKFTMIFEDPNLTNKYKGTYFLSNCLFRFMNDSGEGDFSLIAAVEFRRMS